MRAVGNQIALIHDKRVTENNMILLRKRRIWLKPVLVSFIGILVLSLFWSCTSQPSYRLYRVYSYDPADVLEGYTAYEYDMSGNRIKFSVYSAPDILTQYYTYEYGSGRLQKITQYDGSDTLLFYRLFTDDLQNRVTRADIYDTTDTLMLYIIYEYDASSNLAHSSAYSAADVLGSYLIYEYNGGRLRKRSAYNDADVLQNYSLYTYGENGRIGREDIYDSGDSLTMYSIYEYEKGVSTYETYFGQSSW